MSKSTKHIYNSITRMPAPGQKPKRGTKPDSTSMEGNSPMASHNDIITKIHFQGSFSYYHASLMHK